jgi:hypothetical protein
MRTIAAVVLSLCLLAGCATAPPTATIPFQIECNVPDAALFVDDALVGRAGEWSKPGKFLRAGFYRIEIRHPKFYSHFEEFTVADGGSAVVKAQLHPSLE